MRIECSRTTLFLILSSVALPRSNCLSTSSLDPSWAGRTGSDAKGKPTPRLSSTATAATPDNSGECRSCGIIGSCNLDLCLDFVNAHSADIMRTTHLLRTSSHLSLTSTSLVWQHQNGPGSVDGKFHKRPSWTRHFYGLSQNKNGDNKNKHNWERRARRTSSPVLFRIPC